MNEREKEELTDFLTVVVLLFVIVLIGVGGLMALLDMVFEIGLPKHPIITIVMVWVIVLLVLYKDNIRRHFKFFKKNKRTNKRDRRQNKA